MEDKKSKCTLKCHDFKKTKFATKKDADNDIERIWAKSKRAKKPIRSYQCNFCKLWLLTSKEDKLEPLYKEIEGYKILLQTERAKHDKFINDLKATLTLRVKVISSDKLIDNAKRFAILREVKRMLNYINNFENE